MSEIRFVSFLLSARSLDRLAGVHPLLEQTVKSAIHLSKVDFTVIEGVRSIEKQREYFRAGRSRTLRSKHLTGHAVDLMPYGDFDGDGDMEGSWELKHFYPLNDAMQAAAHTLGVKVTWGGSWASFVDAPHFEIDPLRYPFT